MKVLCAWCGSTIQIRCNHCNAPTIAANILGGSFGLYGDAMVCLNGETPVVFTQVAIDRMENTYGLCDPCAELPADQRDAMIKIRRAKDHEIPTTLTSTSSYSRSRPPTRMSAKPAPTSRPTKKGVPRG